MVLVAVLLLAGSAWAQPVLVYGTTDKVTDMDPASAYDQHTWDIFQNIDKGLLAYEPGIHKVIPGLAESYPVNARHRVYFQAAQGARVHRRHALLRRSRKVVHRSRRRAQGRPLLARHPVREGSPGRRSADRQVRAHRAGSASSLPSSPEIPSTSP